MTEIKQAENTANAEPRRPSLREDLQGSREQKIHAPTGMTKAPEAVPAMAGRTAGESRNLSTEVDPFNRSKLRGIAGALHALRQNKERDYNDLTRQIEEMVKRRNHIENELRVIDAKEQACRTAMRTLEDLNITE